MRGTSIIGLVRDVLRGARIMARYTSADAAEAGRVRDIIRAPFDYDPDTAGGRIAEHTGNPSWADTPGPWIGPR